MRRRPRSQLTPLSEALGKSLGRGHLNFVAQKLRIFELWPQIVGPEVAAKSKAQIIDGSTLTVLVPGPAYLNLFSYQKTGWLRRLNAELAGEAELSEIILKVGEF